MRGNVQPSGNFHKIYHPEGCDNDQMSAHKILIWVEVTELFERKELSDYYANICPQMAATDQSESSILERRLLIINIWEKSSHLAHADTHHHCLSCC